MLFYFHFFVLFGLPSALLLNRFVRALPQGLQFCVMLTFLPQNIDAGGAVKQDW